MNGKKEAVNCKFSILEYMRKVNNSRLELWWCRVVHIQYGKLKICDEPSKIIENVTPIRKVS